MAVTGGAIASWAGTAAGAATIASTAVAAYGAVEQRQAGKEAGRQAEKSAAAQAAARAEQKAQAAQAAANERRQQIREERVKRARIIQAGENTGTAGSAGEAGALGSLGTQLATNIGANLGAIRSAENQSIFAQTAADANFAGQQAQIKQSNARALSGLGMQGIKAFGPTGASTLSAGLKKAEGSIFYNP